MQLITGILGGVDGEFGQTLLPAGEVQLAWDSCNWPLPAFLEVEGKQCFPIRSVCARQMECFAFHLLLIAGNGKGKSQVEFVTHSKSESRPHLPGEQAAMKGCLIQRSFCSYVKGLAGVKC